MRPVYTASARRHVLSAIDWYNKQEDNLGALFQADLLKLEDRLEQFPKISPIHKGHIRRATLASFPYFVFYYYETDQAVIVAVIHASQHPDTWKKNI